MSETPANLIVIGLTGGIASGKSLVRSLAQRDADIRVIDADHLGHLAYLPGTRANDALVACFGPKVRSEKDGSIVRPELGKLVFGHPENLKKLNAIVWPEIRALLKAELQKHAASPAPPRFVIVEAAVLLEAGWTDLVDEIWVITTSPQAAAERIVKRNGFSLEDAKKRVQSQMTNAQRARRAHVLLSNHGSEAEFTRAVLQALSEVRERHARAKPELVDIVDPTTNRVVDVRKRSVMRAFNLPHRATYVVARHVPTGKLVVQTRSPLKDYCPRMMDPAPGGVVNTGETFESNAEKEMSEELGLRKGRDYAEMRCLGDFWFEDAAIRAWGRVFELDYTGDVSKLVLQEEEVESVQLMSPEELVRNKDRVTPDGYRALLEWAHVRGVALRNLGHL